MVKLTLGGRSNWTPAHLGQEAVVGLELKTSAKSRDLEMFDISWYLKIFDIN